jgi:hypothetical protein
MPALYYWCRNKILGRNFEEKRRMKLARDKYTDIITSLNCKYRGVKGFGKWDDIFTMAQQPPMGHGLFTVEDS